jgi:hypothetical protein
LIPGVDVILFAGVTVMRFHKEIRATVELRFIIEFLIALIVKLENFSRIEVPFFEQGGHLPAVFLFDFEIWVLRAAGFTQPSQLPLIQRLGILLLVTKSQLREAILNVNRRIFE